MSLCGIWYYIRSDILSNSLFMVGMPILYPTIWKMNDPLTYSMLFPRFRDQCNEMRIKIFAILFIDHWSLFIDHHSLFIVPCSLFIVHCSLFIIHCSQFIVHCSSFIVHCWSFLVCCLLFIVYCSLFVVNCS